MKKILVAGSIAYDHIMNFDGYFKDNIFPEDMGKLSISFLAKKHDFNYGGCGPNIAYTLSLLGNDVSLLGIAGVDFAKYKKWLSENNIKTNLIEIDNDDFTAAAYILSDKSHSQIGIFSPSVMQNEGLGMNLDHIKKGDFDLAIISPGLPKRMTKWAEGFKDKNLPYIFDPGQALSVLSKKELLEILDGADGLILNEYEANLFSKKTGLSLAQLLKKLKFLIKTLGKEGCELWEDNEVIKIPAIEDVEIKDTTGCGDAFRSGFLYGLSSEMPLKRAAEMACTASSFVIEKVGTQNHSFSVAEFNTKLLKYYSN
jgi:adenosine kinase